ncbi:MAG: clostripain-related cysteine peptidase [Candidatus Bathyarchaeia archaeon]
MKTKRIGTFMLMAIAIFAVTHAPLALASRGFKNSWTFMVYLDADNNLDSYGLLNLQQMSIGLSPEADVNVVVLMDRLAQPAYVYKVTHNNIQIVLSLGEVDMGSTETLAWFVEYAMENYASKYYLLDMWDHGGGYRGVCWDESSGKHLSPHDIETALATAEKKVSRKIDIVGFDACLMGMIEVCYELKDVANIVIGSEMLIPGYGWPYENLMQYLSANPNVDPYTFSKEIVTEYVSYYESMQSTYFVQLSAINEAYVPEMAKGLNAFADYLSRNINEYKGVIAEARGASQQKFIMGTMGAYYYIDLYKFTSIVMENTSDKMLDNLALTLMGSIDKMVFCEDHISPQGNLDAKQYGLTINFPPNKEAYNPNYETYVQCFTTETTWLNFLMTYYKNI